MDEPVFLEMAGCHDRYHAALMRCAWLGTMPQVAVDMEKTCQDGLQAALEAIRPGAACEAPHVACQQVIDRAGFTDNFRKRAGYSIGIAFAPDWGEGGILSLYTGVTTELRPGMTFHIPVALRVFGQFTVGVSETVVVTETGCRVLSAIDRADPARPRLKPSAFRYSEGKKIMKDITECHARLRGLFNITVTPFKVDGAFDYAGLARNIERVIGLGFDGILIGGTYGEFPAMSTEERADLFRRVMDIVGDRVPVMLCSAGSDVRVVRELTALAGDLGGLPMVTPPFVSEVTDAQIVAFFRDMVPLSRTGVLVYNAPGIGITLSPPTLEQLADIPGVVGVKQGDLSPTAIDQIANRIGGRIRLFCASDLAFLGPMMCGFDGISSTNSCALPELILAAYRALEAGDAATARDLHRLWYPFRALAREFGQPQTTKAAMNLRGFDGGSVRRPLRDLEAASIGQVARVMRELAADRRSSVALAA